MRFILASRRKVTIQSGDQKLTDPEREEIAKAAEAASKAVQ